MEDILLSPNQYHALLERLDEVRNDVTAIRLKTSPETAFIDAYNLAALLKVTNRTLQRWRKDGRLPYLRIGKKLYYNLDLILSSFRVESDSVIGAVRVPVSVNELDDEVKDMACIRCPLFVLLEL